MEKQALILALDQGTTSSRAITFTQRGHVVSQAQEEIPQYYPHNGWVEHRPEDLWQMSLRVMQLAFKQAETRGGRVVAIAITNQRETALVWHKDTLQPVYNAIVWQDRRHAQRCNQLKASGIEDLIRRKTGLLLDPYFSAGKLQWILQHKATAKDIHQHKLCCGTVDSFLVAQLTKGARHLCDATNASRTSLFNIHELDWDDELLNLFNIPRALMPEVLDCAAEFGYSHKDFFGREIPILGIAGDQHAALIGQACFQPGMAKSTYGTGCFMLKNIGSKATLSKQRLLTTLAYQIDGQACYALEGSIFVAGSCIQWLRDSLGIIQHAQECEALAQQANAAHGLYFVPAFSGLGAPHWHSAAKGSLFGLGHNSGRAEIVRASLEAVAYQSNDLVTAMNADNQAVSQLRVDGGMAANTWLLQFLSDILQVPIRKPTLIETTALGAAQLAGLKLGWYSSLQALSAVWQQDCQVTPQMSRASRNTLLAGWQHAVQATLAMANSTLPPTTPVNGP